MRMKFIGFIAAVAMLSGAGAALADVGLRPLPRPEFTAPQVTQAQMQLAPVAALPSQPSAIAPQASFRPVMRTQFTVPDLRWDNHPRGTRWSIAIMNALRTHGRGLVYVVLADIEAWCPAYESGDDDQRAAFWAGLVSALAWHESTHRPTAVGGGGLWFGLTQIAPPTADWRNCEVTTGEGLLDGPANLRCAIRIMAITVPRDGVVSAGMRGVAADWGPFHSSRKREDMRQWVSRQDYCRGAMRPVLRPADLATRAMLTSPSEPAQES